MTVKKPIARGTSDTIIRDAQPEKKKGGGGTMKYAVKYEDQDRIECVDYDEYLTMPPVMGTAWECWRPMYDGTYDVVVSGVDIHRTPGGCEILIIELTATSGLDNGPEFAFKWPDRGPHFVAISSLNGTDNNYYARQLLSAILRREVTNNDYVGIADLYGRRARVHAGFSESGRRVLKIESHERGDKVPEYEREVTTDAARDPEPYIDYIPLYDMGYGW